MKDFVKQPWVRHTNVDSGREIQEGRQRAVIIKRDKERDGEV